MAWIMSLNVGLPAPLKHKEKEVSSGIDKRPVPGQVWLTRLHFEGDGQADLVHHGGVEKAVCVYPHEHYPFWEKELDRTLDWGAFGENLTTEGLTEQSVCIGDVYRMGEALVQVSQPRQPCYKLSVKYGQPELPLMVQETGFTGFYFRVLEEGHVGAGDRLELVRRHPEGITVSYANRIMHQEKDNREAIRRILSVEPLSANWRATFEKRLTGQSTDTKERLTGQA